MIKIYQTLVILLCLATLSGCSYSVTSHRFTYHGTDFPQSDKDFFYVEEGVFGSATANYDLRGGGHVREGLIADAKADLRFSNPLEKNQIYANLSLDLMETETGTRGVVSGVRKVKRLELTAVVTADIMEFGEYEEKKRPTLGTDLNQSAIPLIRNENLEKEERNRYDSEGESPMSSAAAGTPIAKFQVGENVRVEFGGRERTAVVLQVTWSPQSNQFRYECEYKTNSGNVRTTSRLEELIIKN